MRTSTLLLRSLYYYWRTNLAVTAGVAIAVGVLAGALTVGASVRASLRDLVLQRIGQTDHAVVASGFFREDLASAFDRAVPLVALEGFVTGQGSGRRASRVKVYGVDDRFWRFHHVDGRSGPARSEAFLSETLAEELATNAADSVILRVEQTSAIPTESLHGRKEDVGRSVRLTVREVLGREELGEFSLSPQQGSVRAMFVPLGRLQATLEQAGRANVILVSGGNVADAERRVRSVSRLEDLGLRVRALPEQHQLALESRSTILNDAVAAAGTTVGRTMGLSVNPTLAYLANSLRAGDREVPYSVVAAVDLAAAELLPPGVKSVEPSAIVLNDWAARDLRASIGDMVSLDYYLWETEGRLSTRTADFHVAAIVPIAGRAADRDLVPEYPGITDSDRLSDWDPPFPIDLKRVRPIDEEYWKQYRATPKAFISVERGRELWASRHGALTSLRLVPEAGASLEDKHGEYERALRAQLDPLSMGFSVYDVRGQSLGAAAGATDFGEYFTYFSTFLVVSALLLAGLFFKFGVEQRLQEVGLLQALGLDAGAIRRLFVSEGLTLSVLGGVFGSAAAVAYAATIMFGLRTWWIGAVGTTALSLHVDPGALAAGAVAVVVIAVAAIWWSLRSVADVSPRSLLKGEHRGRIPVSARAAGGTMPRLIGLLAGAVSLGLLAGAAANVVPRVAGFFGAGTLALVAMLCLVFWWLDGGKWRRLHGHGLAAMGRMGWRNTTSQPSRSVLCIALIAFATFVIVSVEAFKREGGEAVRARSSGTGGYLLLLDTLLPIVHDLNSPEGRDAVNMPAGAELQQVRFDRFRVRPGDDASCLNLYQPKNPRILGATAQFIDAGRFSFQSSLAETPEERANPWRLLDRQFPDGAIPVVTDANSMTYVLHMKLGDDLVLPGSSERPIRLRLVGALSDSIFQGELLMAEAPFVRMFPEWEGHRFFLVDAPDGEGKILTGLLESRLSDFGADVASTAERLAGFHRVEYTYLSTFQVLGGLGLVLGTIGLGAVLLRNVLERRRELALLRALGYRHGDFFAMIVGENLLLLVWGLVIGTCSALLAIAPSFLDRGGPLPVITLTVLLTGVLVTGLLASLGATAAALRAPLLSALRSE